MSIIIENLKEKFPHNATYTIGKSSVEVYPEPAINPHRAMATLAPGQTIAVDFTIIIPNSLFPDWWVWGCIATTGTPKYICLREPLMNLPPKEYAFLKSTDNIVESNLKTLKQLIEEMNNKLDRLVKGFPLDK